MNKLHAYSVVNDNFFLLQIWYDRISQLPNLHNVLLLLLFQEPLTQYLQNGFSMQRERHISSAGE